MPESRAPTADDLLRHASWLRRLAGQLVGAGAADDLLQETWVSALRHRPQHGVGLGPWLRRVLLNRAASDRRTQARQRRREGAHAQPETVPSSADLAARAETTRLLVEAVLRLKPAQRDVVLLRYFDELQPAAIAARLHLPGATVRSHLARGLAALRADLDASTGGDRDRWMRALAPLTTTLTATTAATPLFATLLMTTAHKITAAVLVGALGAGALYWSLAGDPAAVTSAATLPAPAADPLAASGTDTAARPDASEPHRNALPTADLRVTGRLLDAKSGEPLPHFALGLGIGAASEPGPNLETPVVAERVTTDADGRFRSTREFAAGPMHAVLLEDWDRFASVMEAFGADTPRPAVEFTHTPGDAAALRVASGPAFRIDCAQAEAIGTDRFLALLCDAEAPMGNAAVLTHLIAQPSLLARFAPVDRQLRRQRPDTLHLLSKDGAWDGWAKVELRDGLPTDPVRIELFACGRLDLTVRSSTAPQPDEVRVTLYRGALAASELSSAAPLWERMTGGALGAIVGGAPPRDEPLRFSVGHQRVGTYTAVVRSRGFDDLVTTIELDQGEDNERQLTLLRSGAATGSIIGHVRPRSGHRPELELVAWLRATDNDAGSERMAQLEWSDHGGRWSGRFVFDGLLDDEYRVWINNGPRVPRPAPRPDAVPREYRVRPDGAQLEFELGDAPATTSVEVRASDRATGAALEEFTVFALLPRGDEQQLATAEGGRAQVNLPGDLHKARLVVHLAGYAPAVAEVPAASGDGVRRLHAQLDSGWGAAVMVMTLADGKRQPLSDAVVLADGVEVARTDESGLAWLALAARPARLDATVAGASVDTRIGAIDDQGRLQEPTSATGLETFGFVLRR